MSEKILQFRPSGNRAFIDDAKYQAMYAHSMKDPEWVLGRGTPSASIGPSLFTKVKNTSFAPDNVSIKWFEDGETINVSYNCVDRHLDKRGDPVAIIWESDDPSRIRRSPTGELHAEVRGSPTC